MTTSRQGHLLAALLSVALVCGCASTQETRFYTLLAPAPAIAEAAPAAAFAIEVLPVSVPEQVDVPQLVLRRSDGELSLVESRQWVAPLGRELRAALADRLTQVLGARDVHRLAAVSGVQVWRVKVDVARFDSVLGRYVLLDAGWSIGGNGNGNGNGARLTCATQVREDVGSSYEALVAGHQRALAGVADRIAGAIRQLAAGGTAACPG